MTWRTVIRSSLSLRLDISSLSLEKVTTAVFKQVVSTRILDLTDGWLKDLYISTFILLRGGHSNEYFTLLSQHCLTPLTCLLPRQTWWGSKFMGTRTDYHRVRK